MRKAVTIGRSSTTAALLVLGCGNLEPVAKVNETAAGQNPPSQVELVTQNVLVPDVTLDSPADSAVVNDSTVSFTCTATDSAGLQEVTLYLSSSSTTVAFSGPTETDDAYFAAETPDANFGSDPSINDDNAAAHAHAVMKFPNMIGLHPGQVPPGARISSAVLEVKCANRRADMEIYPLTEDWDEDEVTWNERLAGVSWTSPGADGAHSRGATSYPADCTSYEARSIDVTEIVQSWSLGSASYGILFIDTGEETIDFDSSESASPPVLTVTFRPDWRPIDTKSISGNSATLSFTTTLPDDQDYLWNCLVTNMLGEQSYARPDSVVNVDRNAPDEPSAIALADGASGVFTSPVLEVDVRDPNGDALDVTFFGRPKTAVPEFTIVVLPDTQHYADSAANAGIYTSQTQWIVDNVLTENIVFVTHEGDIVHNWDQTIEWERADASMTLLDSVVPYGMGPGNHEQPTTLYNVYFPYTRYEAESWYGGHYSDNNDNNYQLFSAGGMDFIIVHLEFCPPAGAITWADSVFKAHPKRTGMVTTHGYIDLDAKRRAGDLCPDASYIWDDLVVPNPNVYFVFCGHVNGESRRTDVVNGREVHQLLADYQRRPNGGDGWLRLLRFVPAENKVYVETYSPWLDRYETDVNSEFSLDFSMREFSNLGTATAVPSGSKTSVSWPGLEELAEHEWYVTVTDTTGKSRTGPLWSFTTASPRLPP